MIKTGKKPTASEVQILRDMAKQPERLRSGDVSQIAKRINEMALQHGLPKIDGLYFLDGEGEFCR